MFKLLPLALAMMIPALAAAQAAPDDIRVRIVTARTQPLDLDMQLSGEIEAVDTLELGFRQGGRVTEVLVAEGDRVVAGQPLARLNAVQQDQALNVALAGLAAARAGSDQARQARDRADALLARGVGTRAAADQAEQALSQTQGALERAETAVEQARRAVDDAVLRAPEDAVVTDKSVAPGQVVAAAQPVLTLAALSGLEAVFHAPDDPLLHDILGRDVRMETLDVDRPNMVGTVTEIAPLVDPQTGTVTVRARLLTPNAGIVLLGASVRGHLSMAMEKGVVVPWTALMRSGDDPAVWVVDDDGRVALTKVVINHFADSTIFVSEGLSDGQRVVGDGAQLLYPGRRVQPVAEGVQ
ncbi:efflux RND transporter periplasmic adaptor subunit [Paracoccus sp. Arc7-R13]|uniref:efflux RND transporter periplasmic adaptor subunit n=1 Tax=Paracoccus sp. Arc7-R13 TaxID=2500532 RepID=UPI000FD7C790|nr:efflux RND transporter periplasmic adaptor subunit [Paracoccus sp. Arc7-R13]AZY92805.1 efflux RND transporter periplasmic adaptor subunit [Paracoccus sp. Arc7-R13]